MRREGIDDDMVRAPAGRTAGRPRGRQAGMTLVEISVALAVLGLVMVSGVPFLQRWKETIDLRGAAAKVADIMLSARMRSVVDRAQYTVRVDYDADTCAATPTVGVVQQGGSVDIYTDDTDPDCPSLSGGNVVFRPNSTADAAGFEAVYIKSKRADIAVRYRVKVLGATGKVGVEKWAGGAWSGAS